MDFFKIVIVLWTKTVNLREISVWLLHRAVWNWTWLFCASNVSVSDLLALISVGISSPASTPSMTGFTLSSTRCLFLRFSFLSYHSCMEFDFLGLISTEEFLFWKNCFWALHTQWLWFNYFCVWYRLYVFLAMNWMNKLIRRRQLVANGHQRCHTNFLSKF